jgi:hypothetical protein
VKHRDVPKFEPTDIVPLTNMAFPKSFGNVLNAKRAIQKRGWNPLNYYLPKVLPTQEVVDLTTSSQENKENDPPTLTEDKFEQWSGQLLPGSAAQRRKEEQGEKETKPRD